MTRPRWAAILFALLTLAAIIAVGCMTGRVQALFRSPPEIALYHWKTTYDPSELEQKALKDIPAAKLYLRLFDVKAFDTWPVPVATAIFSQKPSLPVTPVVFIDQEIFTDSNSTTLDLGKRIAQRVNQIVTGNTLSVTRELQLDCDWTPSSKDAFFQLVKDAKAALPKDWTISVTLRLYQFRHPDKAGIPPADRVALMAYNMGKLREFGDHNSIIDPAVAAHYMNARPYPLPLDIALPLFSWGVVFDADNEYRGLIRRLPEELVALDRAASSSAQWQREGTRIYRLQAPIYLEGRHMEKGWAIRVERTTPAALHGLAKQLQRAIPHADTVIFYHLDQDILKEWPSHALRDTAAMFR